jgi:hypothetical protein
MEREGPAPGDESGMSGRLRRLAGSGVDMTGRRDEYPEVEQKMGGTRATVQQRAINESRQADVGSMSVNPFIWLDTTFLCLHLVLDTTLTPYATFENPGTTN